MNAFMPMISVHKTYKAATKGDVQIKEASVPSGNAEIQNQNLEFADFMHRKLQDLDLMLMKDKGVTTITKLVLQFDDRIKGIFNKKFVLRIPMLQSRMCPNT